MGSTSTVSADDEEFMEDLITLTSSASGDSDCEIISDSENKSRPEIKNKPHSDAQKKPPIVSSYGKGDFYLPARFFDIESNRSLISICRALRVCVVDCGKFSWYYRNKFGIRKPRPKSKQIYTLQTLLEDMCFEQKIKQQKYEKLPLEHNNKSKEVIGKVNLTPSKDPSSVDFKKNKGLVGLKIERKLVGLVTEEKSKEEKKNKKHTAEKSRNKIIEGKETKNEKGNSLCIEMKKANKDEAKPGSLIIDKVNKVFRKETSLKCSLNLKPLLSPSVQQKLLEIASKSAQHTTTSSSINDVQLLSSNTHTNTTIIGQTDKPITVNSAKVSTCDSISVKTDIATPKVQAALNKNTLLSDPLVINKNNADVENKLAEDDMPEKSDAKDKLTPSEDIKPELVHIKSEPEIRQGLKDEELVPDKSINESPTITVNHLNPEVASASPLSNLRSFRRSIENSLVPNAPNHDLREFVGQTIPVQTSGVSNQNIVNSQWYQYNEAGLHANLNYPQNNHPPYNMTTLPTQPNVNNLQVLNQNILSDNTKPKVGDLKIQTVSQINRSIVTREVSAPKEVVQNYLQNNELQSHHNDLIAQSTVLDTVTNNPGPIPLIKKNNSQEKKIVRPKKSYLMNNQSRYEAVRPYTVPPSYQQYGYQPRMRTSGYAAQWSDHANKMPLLMQHLNQKQRPQLQSFWEPPPPNQDFLCESLSANPAYIEYYQNNWTRPQQPPAYTAVERRMKNVPSYARQKVRAPNCMPPNSRPQKSGVFRQKLPQKTAVNQGTSLPVLSPYTRPIPVPPPAHGMNNISQTLPTLPTPLTSATIIPTLSSLSLNLPVPKPVQEVHTAGILYPNTTFSEESFTSHAINTEGSNHIKVATYENQQNAKRSLDHINTTEIPQSPTSIVNEMTLTLPKASKDIQKERALDMPDLVGIECDAANVISSQQQAKNNTPAEIAMRKPSNAANNLLLSQQQKYNTSNDVATNRSSAQQMAKNDTPKKSNPPAAPKQTHHANIFPKKRLYIPNDYNEMPPYEGTASSVSERSVPAVLERNVNKGYSPPILPIPTVQKSLEILALVNAIKTPNNEQNNSLKGGTVTSLKQSGLRNDVVDSKTQVTTPRRIKAPCCIIENPPVKRKLNQTPQSATKARKISIEEYKKRQDNSKSIDTTDESQDRKNKELTPTKDKGNRKRFYMNNENRGVDLQDLGYDSDPSSKF